MLPRHLPSRRGALEVPYLNVADIAAHRTPAIHCAVAVARLAFRGTCDRRPVRHETLACTG